MEPEKAPRLVQPTGQVRHLIALGGPRQGRSLGQRLGDNAVSAWLKKSRLHGWFNRKRLRARLPRRRCLRASDSPARPLYRAVHKSKAGRLTHAPVRFDGRAGRVGRSEVKFVKNLLSSNWHSSCSRPPSDNAGQGELLHVFRSRDEACGGGSGESPVSL